MDEKSRYDSLNAAYIALKEEYVALRHHMQRIASGECMTPITVARRALGMPPVGLPCKGVRRRDHGDSTHSGEADAN